MRFASSNQLSWQDTPPARTLKTARVFKGSKTAFYNRHLVVSYAATRVCGSDVSVYSWTRWELPARVELGMGSRRGPAACAVDSRSTCSSPAPRLWRVDDPLPLGLV